ncbi:hypothetical protein WAI453_012155 [Rhynchosporium graminicola]
MFRLGLERIPIMLRQATMFLYWRFHPSCTNPRSLARIQLPRNNLLLLPTVIRATERSRQDPSPLDIRVCTSLHNSRMSQTHSLEYFLSAIKSDEVGSHAMVSVFASVQDEETAYHIRKTLNLEDENKKLLQKGTLLLVAMRTQHHLFSSIS